MPEVNGAKLQEILGVEAKKEDHRKRDIGHYNFFSYQDRKRNLKQKLRVRKYNI